MTESRADVALSATGLLRAYDEITLGGLGQSEVTIERIFVTPVEDEDEDEDDGAWATDDDEDADDGGS